MLVIEVIMESTEHSISVDMGYKLSSQEVRYMLVNKFITSN